jgi:hypothetical protein
VDRCLADLARDRVVSVPGAPYRAILGLTHVLPRRTLRWATSRVGRGRGRT